MPAQGGQRPVHLKLRDLRERRGLTLQQLHAATGLRVTLLSDLERGQVQPASGTLRALARAYGAAGGLGGGAVARNSLNPAPGPPEWVRALLRDP